MKDKTMRGRTLSALIILTAIFGVLSLASPALALQQKAVQKRKSPRKVVQYVCPMHPEVTSRKRGRCPKCGMNLVVKRDAPETSASEVNGAASNSKATTDVSTPLRIPDVPVYDQNNRRLNFYTDLVKGKTVAINFIFTTCTTICPPLTATFRRVQQTLGERVGRDVELISISVDPVTDVPERLKDFSAQFKAGPGWTFVTGSKPEIDRLLNALGGYAPDRNDHTPMVLIGNDAAGYWTRTYGLAPASQLVGIVTDAASKSKTAESEGAAAAKSDSQADASANYFPNLMLRTQDNKPVRFYEDLLKGKTVLINFLFTTCKGVCPPMTANLARVQKLLGERMGRDILMISISVDPMNDTPEVLKKFAVNFKAQSGWYFLTGEKKNVDWVLYKLGGYVEDKQQHTGVLIIGNEATGDWMKVMAMSNPEEIARAATALASKKN